MFVGDLHEAAAEGLADVESMKILEKQLAAKGLTVQRGTSAHLHSIMVGADSAKRDDMAVKAAQIVAASKQLKSKSDI